MAQCRFDVTETGAAKSVTISEAVADALPDGCDPHGRTDVHDVELFEGITTPGKLLLLVSWRTEAAAEAWQPAVTPRIRHRRVRVIRDYGMIDRREAPQFYPDVARRAAGG